VGHEGQLTNSAQVTQLMQSLEFCLNTNAYKQSVLMRAKEDQKKVKEQQEVLNALHAKLFAAKQTMALLTSVSNDSAAEVAIDAIRPCDAAVILKNACRAMCEKKAAKDRVFYDRENEALLREQMADQSPAFAELLEPWLTAPPVADDPKAWEKSIVLQSRCFMRNYFMGVDLAVSRKKANEPALSAKRDSVLRKRNRSQADDGGGVARTTRFGRHQELLYDIPTLSSEQSGGDNTGQEENEGSSLSGAEVMVEEPAARTKTEKREKGAALAAAIALVAANDAAENDRVRREAKAAAAERKRRQKAVADAADDALAAAAAAETGRVVVRKEDDDNDEAEKNQPKDGGGVDAPAAAAVVDDNDASDDEEYNERVRQVQKQLETDRRILVEKEEAVARLLLPDAAAAVVEKPVVVVEDPAAAAALLVPPVVVVEPAVVVEKPAAAAEEAVVEKPAAAAATPVKPRLLLTWEYYHTEANNSGVLLRQKIKLGDRPSQVGDLRQNRRRWRFHKL
jgi:hypothetical protein